MRSTFVPLFVATLLPLTVGEAMAQRPTDFDRDVAPILSRHCLRCHGATGPEAGLDLTSFETATAEAASGLPAIVPGSPEESELIRRIAAVDPAERMPAVGAPLDPSEIATLRSWIEAGAEWPSHWAYRPLHRTYPPDSEAEHPAWARNPIDLFVLDKLREKGLEPSPPADKRTWLRRVTFDLTGLPPTPDELRAFLADDAPDAYARAADRLLASPHYGERWARHWMDVARFAETHGHDQDRPRPNAWPYRDYLIRSFNGDKPYGRFVEEQIAGDVLFPDAPQAIVATGFLAAGPWDESSLRDIREDSLDREIARSIDRDEIVTAVMTAFASTTVQCARCHDHKFDPIPQSEYYGLQAVFAATDKADRPYDPDPAVARRRRELIAQKQSLPALKASLDPALLAPELQAEVAAWESDIAAANAAWVTLEPETFESSGGATLTKLADGSLLAGGTRPETDVYTVTAPVGLRRVTGIRIELLTDESLPHHGPGRQDNGNLHLNELTVTAASAGRPETAWPVALRHPRSDFDQEGWTVAMALDSDPKTAWGIYPEVGKPHRAVFELVEPIAADGNTTLTFRLKQTHGGGHLIGRLRLSITDTDPPLPLDVETLPSEVAAALRVPADTRTERQKADLAAYHLERTLDRELAELPPQQFVYAGTNRFRPDGSFRPADRPRTVHVLHRGDVREPREVAVPGALSCVPGLSASFSLADPDDEGARRAALARWMSDPRNVLVWRSIANRVWQYHFGRGLVETPNDFGRMGAPPSHRELLDWLAVELIESGGSLKHLHRLIVTSATYRQSSAHNPNAAATDAENRLLWRMNRTRLDAESTRDAILSFTRGLDRKMGGPSVKQFIESPGIHVTPVVNYRDFGPGEPANRRRSVYRFLFRTLPDPFFETLDCPDGSQVTAKRTESITALQALVLRNDPFVVYQCGRLADRLQAERPDLSGQIDLLYSLVLLREPTADEQEHFVRYAEEFGLANACRVLLNSNEFVFVD